MTLLQRTPLVKLTWLISLTILSGCIHSGKTVGIQGKQNEFSSLLSASATVDLKSEQANSPFMLALRQGNLDIILILIRQQLGGQVPTEDIRMMWTMFGSQPDVFRLKLLQYVDEHPKLSDPILQLINACKSGDVAKVCYFATKDTINGCDDSGQTPLLAATKHGSLPLVKLLLDRGANPDLCDQHGRTPLMMAAQHGWVILIIELLDHMADPTLQDEAERSALIYALTHGHEKAAKELIDRAREDFDVKEMRNAFQLARSSGLSSVATMLQKENEKGIPHLQRILPASVVRTYAKPINSTQASPSHLPFANFSSQQTKQSAPMHDAMLVDALKYDRSPHMLTILIKQGTTVNFCDRDGNTLLMLAAMFPESDAVSWLLDHGADPNLKNKYGGTALMIAATYNHIAGVNNLLNHGAYINSVNNANQSALFFAVYKNHPAVVKILLDKAVDTTIRDCYGYTALDWANEKKYSSIIQLLTN